MGLLEDEGGRMAVNEEEFLMINWFESRDELEDDGMEDKKEFVKDGLDEDELE